MEENNYNISKERGQFVILLDEHNTCTGIDKESACIFLEQIEKLRKKFNCEEVIISMSTNYYNHNSIKHYLDLLSLQLPSSVKIGTSFFYGGQYDYNLDVIKTMPSDYNDNRWDTFKEYYLMNSEFNVSALAIISASGIFDANNFPTLYENYKKNYCMFVAKPSQFTPNVSDNFMNLSTPTYLFPGVIELINQYLISIEGMEQSDILREQESIIDYLSIYGLLNLIKEKNFSSLLRYLENMCIDDSIASDLLCELLSLYENNSLSANEKELAKQIVELIFNHVQNPESVQGLKRRFLKNN